MSDEPTIHREAVEATPVGDDAEDPYALTEDPLEAWEAFTAVVADHKINPNWRMVRDTYRELRATLSQEDWDTLKWRSKEARTDPDHGLRPLQDYFRERDRRYQETPYYDEAQRRKEKKRTGTETRRKSANAAQKRYKLKQRLKKMENENA